jgi:hypothetical protein
MYSEPRVIPLNVDHNIYALLDERGNTIGTGTEEVCEVLLYMILKTTSTPIVQSILTSAPRRMNVHSAISI